MSAYHFPSRLLAALVLLLASVAWGQKPKIEPGQRYLLLATSKTSTMQKELEEAAAQGFRILVGSPTSGMEMVLLLERVAEPPDVFRYKLLATTETDTMQKELNQAASEGYRLLPRTMIAKNRPFLGPEVVLIMEGAPKSVTSYEYRLLATSRTSTMQKEITQAIADGFVLTGMVSRGEHMVIMERERKPNPPPQTTGE